MLLAQKQSPSNPSKFNDDESQYLSWTPAAAGNRKTWTWSGWVKRGSGLANGANDFCVALAVVNKTTLFVLILALTMVRLSVDSLQLVVSC